MRTKKIISLLLSVMLILGITTVLSLSAYADDEDGYYVSGDFEYTVLDDGTVEITSYMGDAAEVAIPSEIDGYIVTNLSYSIFSYCPNLISVEIPDSVITADNLFYNCENLKRISIGSGLSNLSSFGELNSLEEITVSADNQNFSSLNGVLFNKDKTEIIRYPQAIKEKSYSIPDGVKTIGFAAFYYCDNLESIAIPNSVEIIDTNAFAYCSSLKNVEIPEGVTKIGSYAFSRCDSLKSVTIPESVSQIDLAFHDSYYDEENGSYVEYYYGPSPFYFCEALEEINVSENNKNYSSLDGVLFNKDKTEIIQYPNGNRRTTYALPSTVTTIGNSYAIHYCNYLINLIIPKSVDLIGYGDIALLSNEKSPTSVTILNPECQISYGQGEHPIRADKIYSYKNSAAEAYAEWINYTFIPLDNEATDGEIIADGTDEKYVIGSESDAAIHCTYPLDEFVAVFVDSEYVDEANYALAEGSTILTFNAEYLDTLSTGEHAVILTFLSGAVSTNLTIEKALDEPTTEEPTTEALKDESTTAEPTTAKPATETTTKAETTTNPSTTEKADTEKSPSTGAESKVILGLAAIALAGGAVMFVKKKEQD